MRRENGGGMKTAAQIARERAEEATQAESAAGSVRLGRELRKLRERHGLMQADVADALGIGRTQVTNIEAGRSLPSLPTLVKFASFYECGLDYIAGHMVERCKPMRGAE